MKPRLFWKILIAYWLTFALTTSAMFVTFVLQANGGRGFRSAELQMREERQAAANLALKNGGLTAFEELRSTWPSDVRSRVRLEAGQDGRPLAVLAARKDNAPNRYIPFAFYLTTGLVFSAILAAYLTRSIDRLREGFRRLSLGEFGTRLAPSMGRRRDEIADLARDFDRMAEQLEQLVASRDRLMHDVSHELKSPLARLDVMVALARLDGQRSAEVFDRIDVESGRINSLVSDLLSLSRAESEASTSADSYFDLSELLRVVCDDAVFEAQARDVAVDLTIDPSLAAEGEASLIVGPPELLRRAVENVVRNAVRFSPNGMTVRVAAFIAAKEVKIEVRDEGPGVSSDMLQRMFDPFVKGNGAEHGVGLGLAIARRAMATYRGRIEAVNPDSGGLLVSLSFPTQR